MMPDDDNRVAGLKKLFMRYNVVLRFSGVFKCAIKCILTYVLKNTVCSCG
jgi:hypothetical protein